MHVNRTEVWKNFDLGTELDIAGTFVYNGLRALHEMRTLDEPEEIFEFFYNLAVGIERLMKVALILSEHDDSLDQQEFEKSLITHTHLELLRRLKVVASINLAVPHNEFLGMLGTFYNSFRYDRFSLSPTWNPDKEKSAMRSFLQKHLSITLNNESSIFPNENTPQIKKFVGNLVQKISVQLYGIITDKARSVNLYTYELRSDSKAAKIFVRAAATFADEDVLWKELLIFLLNTNDQSGLLDYLRSIEPLAFDIALLQEYLQAFRSEVGKQSILDELEALYENLENPGVRLQALQPIGDPNVLFDAWDDELDEDDEDDGTGFA
jgi:hypothetical protein